MNALAAEQPTNMLNWPILPQRNRSADNTGPPEYFAPRMALFYGALFLIYGVHLPYLPVWLDWRGLSPAEIAAITATPFLLRLIVTPAISMMADQRVAYRRFIIALAAAALIASILLSQVSGFWLILLAATALSLAMTTIMPMTETIAVSGLRRHGADYGRMRLWGSATFILANLAGGAMIAAQGASVGIVLIICGCLACACAAWMLPEAERNATTSEQSGEPPRRAIDTDALKRLLGSPSFIALLVATGCVQAAHAAYYTFGTLHWLGQGISPAMAGILWAIGVIAEIALFAVSGRAVRLLTAAGLIVIGCAAAVLRWTIMAADPGIEILLGLQVLHGLTYGAAHLGAIHVIAQMIPEKDAGTAQALYATIGTGAAMGAATLGVGAIYAHAGGLTYLTMSALAVVGLIAAVMLARMPATARHDGG